MAIFKGKLKSLNYLCSKILDQQAVIIWETNAGLKGNNIDTGFPWKINHSKVNSRHLQNVRWKLYQQGRNYDKNTKKSPAPRFLVNTSKSKHIVSQQTRKNIGLSNLKIPKYNFTFSSQHSNILISHSILKKPTTSTFGITYKKMRTSSIWVKSKSCFTCMI